MGFDPSIVSQIGQFLVRVVKSVCFRLLVSFWSWICWTITHYEVLILLVQTIYNIRLPYNPACLPLVKEGVFSFLS